MNIKFYQNGYKLNEKQKEYFQTKILKLEKHLNNETIKVEIEVEQDKKGINRVEIQVKTPGKKRYIIDDTGETIESAFDKALEELKNQITRDKERRRDLQKRASLSIKKKFSIDKSARF